ncbi:HSF-type DNA-binding-domain-containing protein, partial [Ochromonadaceae sp. CCMP2298]
MLLPTPKNAVPLSVLSYRNYANTFPAKLYDLVSNEGEGVVGWHAYGTSFQVRDMERFVSEVLPKHFKHNNFTSFQRQLNLYGFRRSATYDKGSYYHPQFQEGNRDLAEKIRR